MSWLVLITFLVLWLLQHHRQTRWPVLYALSAAVSVLFWSGTSSLLSSGADEPVPAEARLLLLAAGVFAVVRTVLGVMSMRRSTAEDR